jgi:hypothetical protein
MFFHLSHKHRLLASGLLVLLFLISFGLDAQGISIAAISESEANRDSRRPLFPGALSMDYLDAQAAREAARPYWVSTETELQGAHVLSNEPILLNNDIVAFYGHPLSKNMGILGRHTKEELDARLSQVAEEYGELSGGRGVRKAFYLIYGTCWPEGEIGILKESVLKEYIEYAQEHDILVFLDHQIGKYDPVASLQKMLPWLAYPNVHLALDPEWRTTKPMQEIGTVSADEVNRAQKVMEDYIIENNIAGERMLVIHQFNWVMIKNRENVESNYSRVRLVHCADGFGGPALKKQTYAYNAKATNMPIKAFKLFYNLGIPGAGYDNPILKPKEVYELSPRPYIIMYQ